MIVIFWQNLNTRMVPLTYSNILLKLWLIINSANETFSRSSIQRETRSSIEPANRLSADSVITDLFYPFVMGLPIVNTSQYQLVYVLTCSTFNGSYLLIPSNII